MSLGVVVRNQNTIVAASDQSPSATNSSGRLLSFMNRTVAIISGNCAPIEPLIQSRVVPKITVKSSTAQIAQLIHSALVLDIVPQLSSFTGRTEVLVAGFDPIRHTTEPGIYYLDSAADFYLTYLNGPAAVIGASPAAREVLASGLGSNPDTSKLNSITKECFAATRLRWPTAVGSHLRLATITESSLAIEDY